MKVQREMRATESQRHVKEHVVDEIVEVEPIIDIAQRRVSKPRRDHGSGDNQEQRRTEQAKAHSWWFK
jgi:hypothetical protein